MLFTLNTIHLNDRQSLLLVQNELFLFKTLHFVNILTAFDDNPSVSLIFVK